MATSDECARGASAPHEPWTTARAECNWLVTAALQLCQKRSIVDRASTPRPSLPDLLWAAHSLARRRTLRLAHRPELQNALAIDHADPSAVSQAPPHLTSLGRAYLLHVHNLIDFNVAHNPWRLRVEVEQLGHGSATDADVRPGSRLLRGCLLLLQLLLKPRVDTGKRRHLLGEPRQCQPRCLIIICCKLFFI